MRVRAFTKAYTHSFIQMGRNHTHTLPKTTCFPSSHSHLAQVMKNWQPFVLGPLLAMESRPCLFVSLVWEFGLRMCQQMQARMMCAFLR